MSKYVIRAKADEDLERIYRYSVLHFGLSRAEHYISDLIDSFEALAEGKKGGKPRDDVAPRLFSYRCVSHIIYYKMQPGYIDIRRVLHKSMDEIQHL
jgi:toxin ParE1/3/4